MLNEKQIWEILLFEFKMGCKALWTTRNINNAFGSGTANEHTVQWWFKKFCKGDKTLEDEECRLAIGSNNNQLRASLKLVLLQLYEKLLKNSVSTILWLFNIWSKLESW